jgi:hypothetical protein
MAKKTKWLDIPIYDLSLDDDDDIGVYMISLVDNPAMETLGVLLSTELVNPGKKETEDEFINRCIPVEIKDGTAQDEKQAYAICKSKWSNRKMESQCNCGVELESFSDYPDSVKNNAKQVLDWTEKNGWGSCGTAVGKIRANQLANGEPISLDTVKRMYSYLSRHQVDLETSKSFSDGCGYLMYMAWGGKSALTWAESKIKELESDTKQELSVKFSSIKEKKIIVCPVLIPEKLVYRNDIEGKGEGFIKFSADTIEKALRKFNKSNNNTAINFMHQRNKVDGVILESWIIEDPECDKAKVYGFDLPKGTWMSSIYIEDDKFWLEEVKGNELSSFSIEGDFSYKMVKLSEELTELELLNKAIDNMDPVDLLILAEELAGPRYNRRANYRPNLHINCQCNIVDGVWRLGKSESGPCKICIEAQRKYNSKNR